MLPSAHAVLWFLAAFLALWGVSVVWRGLFGDRAWGRRRCPACWKDVAPPALACAACGYASERERDFRAARRRWRLVGTGAGVLVGAVVSAYCGMVVQAWGDPESLMYLGEGTEVWAWEASAWGVAALGIALAVWAWRGDRSRGRRRCPKCWYDMAGVGLKCPECGHEAGAVKRLYRPRRRRGLAALGLAILLGSYGLWIVPRVRAGGWVAAIPTTVLIIGMPWWPMSLIAEDSPSASEDWTLWGRHHEKCWDWQNRWIERRALGILRSRPSIGALRRALLFLPEDRPIVLEVYASMARGLCSKSVSERAAAAELLQFPIIEEWEVSGSADAAPGFAGLAPGLIAGLRDEEPEVSAGCARMLAFTGREAEPGVRRLSEMLGAASDHEERWCAQHALAILAQHSAPAREALLATTMGTDDTAVHYAAYALRAAPAEDARVTTRLLELLRHSSDIVAVNAAASLARRRSDPDIAVRAIVEEIWSDRGNRSHFVSALAWYGDTLGSFVEETLGRALQDPSADVREAAARTVWSLAETSALDMAVVVPTLRERTGDESASVVSAAEAALQAISRKAERLRADESDR